jgi:exonuclease VII large subunit
MSGHKRAFVRLSRAEYEHLRDAAADNRLASSTALQPSPAQAAAVMAQSSSAIWQDLEGVQARQHALENLVGHFDQQVRSLEQATGQALIEQQSQMAEQLDSAAGQLYQAADELLQQHLRSFREQVSHVAHESRAGYAAVQEQWQGYGTGWARPRRWPASSSSTMLTTYWLPGSCPAPYKGWLWPRKTWRKG